MDIWFRVVDKRGKVNPLRDKPKWKKTHREANYFTFLQLCYRLWKWYRKVKKQTAQVRTQCKLDKDGCYFKTRQVFIVETEN